MQPKNSPLDKSLTPFVNDICPLGTEKILSPFEGFRLPTGEEFLYKKISYSLQPRRGTEYGNFYSSDSSLCPRGLPVKPAYIVFHSTDSEKATRLRQPYGEVFFLSRVDQLETRLKSTIEEKRRIAKSVAKREELGEELNRDALRQRLKEFL
jgi:hypothetical protein